jgi:arabinose-5-phosphate isomerase
MIHEQASAVLSAIRTIENEGQGLEALAGAVRTAGEGGLGSAFSQAVERIAAASGRVIVTGMGKSGHVARKIAATLASTGQPASFVHPAEASHGDLGMVQSGDVVLALSWSGETVELAAIVTFAKRYAIPLIAMTASPESALGREADICLALPNVNEACPNGLAPTTSTTMQLVLGDALAIALLEGRGFTALDFRALHPAGQLGARLAHVRDVMHTGERVPRIDVSARMAEAIVEMTSKGFGCVAVFEGGEKLVGIVTDGDLRRHLKAEFSLDTPVARVMTRKPRTIAPGALIEEALESISHKISALLVADKGAVVGIVHFHDLMRIGAV